MLPALRMVYKRWRKEETIKHRAEKQTETMKLVGFYSPLALWQLFGSTSPFPAHISGCRTQKRWAVGATTLETGFIQMHGFQSGWVLRTVINLFPFHSSAPKPLPLVKSATQPHTLHLKKFSSEKTEATWSPPPYSICSSSFFSLGSTE